MSRMDAYRSLSEALIGGSRGIAKAGNQDVVGNAPGMDPFFVIIVIIVIFAFGALVWYGISRAFGWKGIVVIGIILFVIICFFGVMMGAGSSDMIVGSWSATDEIGNSVIEFYDNGLGTAYLNYNKGSMSARDYGMSGYLKKLVIDLRYSKSSGNTYLADGIGIYAESYTGQTVMVTEKDFTGQPIGTFTLQNGYLTWDLNDDISILTRIS
ncbi:hypothetical protein McpSp1_02440 [Methanocorpusculaceae archaeon Sp1]|nr:hypothetical protein [Methanocorpusculaceae archaeon Sp1]